MILRYPFKYLILLILAFACNIQLTVAQLSGTKTIPGSYATIAAAVTALNTSGVGTGGVTFNIAAGYTETITATISLTATGTAANPIVFQKDPGTTGANPIITSYTGGSATTTSATQDGIFRLVGSDYVTINKIDLKENAANTTAATTMEYGYALYKASTSNGCQYVTISNCVITLNRVNNTLGTAPSVDGSSGIIVMNATATAAVTALTPVAGGQNSNNKFYGNTIQNCNTGIALIGYAAASPFTLADVNNDVGGSSSATGNTIINYGGGSSAANPAVAIRTLAQYSINISYNTINNNNGSGVNHPTTLRGIYNNTATSANATINNNTITLKGTGTTTNITGIENVAGSTVASNAISISNNIITNGTYTTATTGGFYGINNSGGPSTLTIDNNTISNNASSASSSGFLYGIYNSGVATNVNLTNTTFSGNSIGVTTGSFVGIYNAAAAPNVNISNNTFSNNATTATAGPYYSIYNTANVTTNLNINNNNIGTPTTPSIIFNAANSKAQLQIYSTKGGTSCALSINNNNFYNMNFAVAGTAAVTLISNAGATLSQAINYNTFNNLNINSTGSFTFITNSVAVAATGTQNVNNNSIVGSFTKAAGGTITLATSTATSIAGGVMNIQNNNFSNITVTGATIIAGLVNTDAGAGTKTISGNTFSNWTGGTGAITALAVNITSNNNATSGNFINNITNGSTITGISTAAGNDNIYGNTINSLSATGNFAVIGISNTAGTTKKLYGNKIYDLQSSGATGTVYGISISGTTGAVTTANIYNNIIGDLRTPAGSAADPVRGISVTSTKATSNINLYNNTIYLNSTSSGATFGTTGIYHTASATTTTATLTLINNIVANISTPNGTGKTVAYRRSSTSLGNYKSNSNNNLFYAGPASTSMVLFYDGTNSDQLLSTYKTRVSARDAQTVTENIVLAFISTVSSSSNFLHVGNTVATQAESGGINISGITTDFDGDIRQGNAGYTGTGTAPDIGADEFFGFRQLPLSGTITVGTGGTYTSLTKTGGLFEAINNLGLLGDLNVNVISDLTEDGTNLLNTWVEYGTGNYSLTIQPNTNILRTISGNVAGAMITLNGVDNVTFDGTYNNAGNYLNFVNTNTIGTVGTAFTFINGASNNTINNCNISAYTNATNGVILFSTSSVAGGNSNNIIDHCNINGTVSGNTSIVGIYSAGTVGNENTNNAITNNNIYDFREKAIDIAATGSNTWTITGNSIYNGNISGSINYAPATLLYGIRILGGFGYSILNNNIGGNASLASGTNAVYGSTSGLLTYEGILLTTSSVSPSSYIQGNKIATITVNSVPTAASSNVFAGIETNGSGIFVGGSQVGQGNIIGSNTINSSIIITTSTTASTNTSSVRGISFNSSGGSIIGNQVAGIDLSNVGTTSAATTFTGIYVNNAAAPTQVNNNIIGSTGSNAATNSIRVLSSSTSTTTLLTGIGLSSAVVSTVQIDGNAIKNLAFLPNISILTLGGIVGISNAATGAASIAITNDTFANNSMLQFTTGYFYGVYNIGAATTLNINYNTFYNNSSTSSTTGLFVPVYNTAAIVTILNINNNFIGNSSYPSFTFSAANSGAQILMKNTAGANTCALSISNNDFGNITFSTTATGSLTYISNSAATLSQAISGNTFTNNNINISGSLTFISNSVVVGSTGIQNVNNNSIVGTFTKTAGGTITLFSSAASSVSGAIINHNNNNFSNITATGATTMAGWSITDAGTCNRTTQGNTFTNWTLGSAAVTVLNMNITTSGSPVSSNIINNIAASATITGILSAGNENCYSNTINTLVAIGSFAVTALSLTGGTGKSIYKNKIYDISASGATGSVNGILVSGATIISATIYNNIIGDLRVPTGNSTTDLIRGISIISTTASSSFNVYFNTIYLNAVSSGTNFSTSDIYHTSSATATTCALLLKDNILMNASTPNGSGNTVALRRSASTLSNYSSTSNNNLFYAGTTGSTRLIYYDGTNSSQTLANFKTLVAPRESASVTQDITSQFLSTTGTSSVYLHINSGISTALESAGINVSGITDDFDGQIRAGNTGYIGTGTSPDIGADEISAIETIPPSISYTLLTNTTSTSNLNMTGVNITDASGINNTTGTKPRIYYKRTRDGNTYIDNTSSTNGWKYTEATNSTSPYSFTINYSLLYGGASVTAGEIEYFITAQDLATIPNVAINSGVFNATPSSVALTSTAFPITGTINYYEIPFNGTYNVGSSEVFTSLTQSNGLFSSINRAGLSGNTIINITSDITEDGTVAINQWTETGVGNYNLTIQSSTATTRLISGNAANGLLILNGVDRFKIDGTISGAGNYLTIRNTNTSLATGTAITFINGCSSDTIRYCNIEAAADANDGVIHFGTTTSLGNSNNLLEYNNINATVGTTTGILGVYSAGTLGNENANNIFSNNNIFGYSTKGIAITSTGSTSWTFIDNSLYNGNATSNINFPAASVLNGIKIDGGDGYMIINNYIGGNASLATGTNATYTSSLGNISFYGILLTTTTGTPTSSIKGNLIKRITLNSIPSNVNDVCFMGIETHGSGITIGGTNSMDGNIVGSNTTLGSITLNTTTTNSSNTSLVRGINCNSAGGYIGNNQVSGIDITNAGTSPASTSFDGIYIDNANPASIIRKNYIGSYGTGAVSNSIRFRATSTSLTPILNGITLSNNVTANLLLDSNYVQNMNSNSTTSSGIFAGILNNANGASTTTITNNNINTISSGVNSNTNSTIYSGIVANAASIINNNTINSLSLLSTSATSQIRGIAVFGNYAYSISNNTVSNLSTASAITSDIEIGDPTGYTLVGIFDASNAGNQVINNNILANFSSTNNTTINTAISGIAVKSNSGAIFNNKMALFSNNATGTTNIPGISGIMIYSGAFNVYNNVVKFSNTNLTNGVRLYGLNDASNSLCNFYFNSINILGYTSGVPARSAAFLRSNSGSLSIKNNLFINNRTGTSINYAISNIASAPSTNFTSTSSDYNDLYNSNAASIGEWGNGNSLNFAQWQSTSAGDIHSLTNPVTFNTSTYELIPNTNSNCNINNIGIPINTPIAITTDVTNITRDPNNPDLGAYEFSYVPFTINSSNNSPTCAGQGVTLNVIPTNAISPTYQWKDNANNILSTFQSPTVTATPGYINVTVTDINGCSVNDSTLVTTLTRPTAHLSAPTAICIGTSFNLTITTTGTGTINGTLSSGDQFSGTAGVINLSLSPTETTTYTITDMEDDNCTSILSDIPDSVTVLVIQGGQWTAAANSTDWANSGNWLCNVLPDTATDVIIPSGLSYYPVINSGTNVISDLTIQSGGTLTINNATLQIQGNISNVTAGAVTATNGTIELYGNASQTVPANLFSTNSINNLNINNPFGVSLAGNLNITGKIDVIAGQLNTGGYLSLISNASQTALVDGTGGGSINGNVIMQRYLPSGFGYKYISSAFSDATVNELADNLNLSSSFPLLYRYDESLLASGFTVYTNTSYPLNPLEGYAANFGASNTPSTFNIKGTVNNGSISRIFYNHNNAYTQGFNLAGNPYPSPIDWNASSGWTKTNIDNAIYYFNNGSTDQFSGTYSSYINGISSDGIANNIIPSLQGFFVHVTNGTFPVTGNLGINNNARINLLNPLYHKTTQTNFPFIRLSLGLTNDSIVDNTVVYFEQNASNKFDESLDALKLMNTDNNYPNVYSVSNDGERMSIVAINNNDDSDKIIPLGIKMPKESIGYFKASAISQIPAGWHIYLYDTYYNQSQDLNIKTSYNTKTNDGITENRFYIVFSKKENIQITNSDAFNAYSWNGKLYVNLNLLTGENGTITVRNAIGQTILQTSISGFGNHEINYPFATGIYIISFAGKQRAYNKKIFIGNN